MVLTGGHTGDVHSGASSQICKLVISSIHGKSVGICSKAVWFLLFYFRKKVTYICVIFAVHFLCSLFFHLPQIYHGIVVVNVTPPNSSPGFYSLSYFDFLAMNKNASILTLIPK